MALPTLVLLFVAIFFVRDLTTARHEARTTARTCAWLYSANDCVTKPPGCDKILEDATALDYQNDLVNQKKNDLSNGSAGDTPMQTQDARDKLSQTSGFLHGLLSPVLDEVFGKATVANVKRSVPRPTSFGGSTTTVPGSYHLACNVSHTTLDSVAKGAWNALSPF